MIIFFHLQFYTPKRCLFSYVSVVYWIDAIPAKIILLLQKNSCATKTLFTASGVYYEILPLFALLYKHLCRREYSCAACTDNNFKNATIINAGDPALDGCRWLIKIDSALYHPDVLEANFLQNNLPVHVVYETLADTFTCGKGPFEYANIHLVSITK